MTYQIEHSVPSELPYDSLVIGLNYHNRQDLYEKINRRIDAMLVEGLSDEARYVYENRDVFRTCTSAIGYKEFFPYFDGTCEIDECVEKLKQASRNYAKRQLTWFHRMKNVNWIYADDTDFTDRAEALIRSFI